MFRFVILPVKPRDARGSFEDLNSIYQLWNSTHSAVTNGAVHADQFLRNDVAVGIFSGPRAVACHLYGFFNIESEAARASRYFGSISESTWDYLWQHEFKNLMSLEFLSVDPEFRKSKVGFSLGEVLISLGQRFVMSTGLDACTGVSRVDVKVERTAESLGFRTVQRGLQIYGYECSFQVSPWREVKAPSDPQVLDVVNQLWATRADIYGYTQETSTLRKIA